MESAAFEQLSPHCACGNALLAPRTHRIGPNLEPVEVACACGRVWRALFWQRQPVEESAKSFEEMASAHRMETD